MNWYKILKFASDYENYRYQVEQLSRKNPYPFSDWFNEDGRSYFPFVPTSEENQTNQVDKDVEGVLSENGYVITDYRGGYCQSGNRTFRIGKVLELLRKRYLQDLQNKFQIGKIYNLEREVERTNLNFDSIVDSFVNSPIRAQKKENEFLILISQNPHDVASMSTGRDWTSCMELGGGSQHQDVFCEIEKGGLVAYLINKNDLEVERPLARIHIRRFENREGKSVAIPENSVYGNQVQGFYQSIQQWLKEKQGDIQPGIYKRQGGEYSDNFGDDMLVAPTGPEDVLKWWKEEGKDVKYSTWTVEDNLYEYFSEEDANHYYATGGDSYDPGELISDASKTFKNKEEAEKYYEEMRMEDWKYGETDREEINKILGFEVDNYNDEEIDIEGPWTKRQRSGQWDMQRYSLREKKHDNSYTMKSEAAKIILKSEKGQYPIETIKELKDYAFGSRQDLKKTFINKYPELLTKEDVSNLTDQNNIEYVLKLQDGDPKKQHYISEWRNTIEKTLEDTSILNDADMQKWLQEINMATDYVDKHGLYDRYKMHLELKVHDYLLSPLQQLFKPIPESIIQKLVILTDKLINEYFNSIPDDFKEKFKQRVNSNIVHTLSLTHSDTPTVQRYYESLIPLYQDEYLNNYSTLNVSTLGGAIARLGENGKQFLPFIKSKLKDSQDYKNTLMKEQEELSPGAFHWTRKKTEIENADRVVEKYLYILDSLESGQGRSSKYRFSQGRNWYKRIN